MTTAHAEPHTLSGGPQMEGGWVEPEGTFAERCRAARRERGWSYGTICRQLSIDGFDTTVASYAAFERGERETRLAEALALRSLLGVEIDPEPDTDTYGVSMTVHHPDGRTYVVSAFGVAGDRLDTTIRDVYRSAAAEHGDRRG